MTSYIASNFSYVIVSLFESFLNKKKNTFSHKFRDFVNYTISWFFRVRSYSQDKSLLYKAKNMPKDAPASPYNISCGLWLIDKSEPIIAISLNGEKFNYFSSPLSSYYYPLRSSVFGASSPLTKEKYETCTAKYKSWKTAIT